MSPSRFASDLACRATGTMSPYPAVVNVTKLKYIQVEEFSGPGLGGDNYVGRSLTFVLAGGEESEAA